MVKRKKRYSPYQRLKMEMGIAIKAGWKPKRKKRRRRSK